MKERCIDSVAQDGFGCAGSRWGGPVRLSPTFAGTIFRREKQPEILFPCSCFGFGVSAEITNKSAIQ